MLSEEFPEWTVNKISSKLGIEERRISKNEYVSSMAIEASKSLFAKSKLNPKDVDFVILCTQSPDFILPTTACIIQDQLGIPTTSGAIDFNQGCSGYIYGLSISKGLIFAGIAKNILLITAEAYSKHIHKSDKSNRAIFGDAATATWIGLDNGFSIEEFILGTDGTGASNLIIKNGGSRHPKTNSSTETECCKDDFLYMNGSEIFNFTIEHIPRLVFDTIKKNRINFSDIDSFIFHQANSFMLEHLRKKIGIPIVKFPIDLHHTGNTVSSTIPKLLENYFNKCDIDRNLNLLLTGFGVGYSWGSVLLKS
jgi:3-oxoacyl-[acyl-carrier-protein] synthase-3